ncbi:MAG: amino acid ABC transporter, periplasmic substrate-binding protein [uncultured Thiotrichaceae bacterium]|uniref:Amino acid ABC transporter, periplasmic substrate-binding protein n=1 Tax=uncultured Thiotrichaceae bacterium TaxID=298394 RepID=A0A6S6TMN9_9GAMM|nr:MAG: amino acid ABC transporter, periplasmic substrate-binding protein [uncultured Thiotrichaceae bacterium]
MNKLNLKKMFYLAVLMSGLGLASQASAASLEKVKEKGILEAAVYKNFPPYSYKEKGKQRGIDIDLAKELASRMSVKPIIRMIGADENMDDDLRNNIWKGHYLGGGTADVMFHAPHDREYAAAVDKVNFISPYQLEKLVFAFDKDKIGGAPTIANFTHDPIGVELDTLSDFYLLRALDGKVMPKVRHYKSVTEAVDALKKGEIAAVMGPRGEVEGVFNKQVPENVVIQHLVTPGLSRSSWALGLAVKADYTKLADEINTHMAAMVKDGTVKSIFNAYGVTYNAPAIAPEKTTASVK